MSDSKDLYEINTPVFVVKIWLEESGNENDRSRWRGHITYLLDGKRRYFQDLDEVKEFILPYLERIGVKLSSQDRLSDFLRRKIGIKW